MGWLCLTDCEQVGVISIHFCVASQILLGPTDGLSGWLKQTRFNLRDGLGKWQRASLLVLLLFLG